MHFSRRHHILQNTITLIILCLSISSITKGDGSEEEGSSSEAPEVTTLNGLVRGKLIKTKTGKDVYGFYGIPFAKPPIGDLRFRKPVPVENWNGTLEAVDLPKTCSQNDFHNFPNFEGETMWNTNTPVSEDCLYLMIWVPSHLFSIKSHNLSVLFWIYGGGFHSGSSTLDIYNGAVLAAENDVIVVSPQYRLGPFGFLYFGVEDAPGNMGLLDQHLALQWVNENIGNFGGDPKSAGSCSVSFHLLSPMSRTLFKRGILMSGTPNANFAFNSVRRSLDIAYEVAKDTGCWTPSSPRELSEILQCLREVEPSVLVDLTFKQKTGILDIPFAPTIDGHFLPDTPEKLLESWETKRTELLIGNTMDEGSYFILYENMKIFSHLNPSSVSYDGFVSIMREIFRDRPNYELQAILAFYANWDNLEDGTQNTQRISDAVGDYFFTCPSRAFADIWSSRGLKVYYYYFTQRTSSNPWAKWMGVLHGDEVSYVMGEPLQKTESYSKDEIELSKHMMRLFVNFAKTGIPSKSWERYSPDFPIYLDLNATQISDETSPTSFGPRPGPCAFWNKYLPRLRETIQEVKFEGLAPGAIGQHPCPNNCDQGIDDPNGGSSTQRTRGTRGIHSNYDHDPFSKVDSRSCPRGSHPNFEKFNRKFVPELGSSFGTCGSCCSCGGCCQVHPGPRPQCTQR